MHPGGCSVSTLILFPNYHIIIIAFSRRCRVVNLDYTAPGGVADTAQPDGLCLSIQRLKKEERQREGLSITIQVDTESEHTHTCVDVRHDAVKPESSFSLLQFNLGGWEGITVSSLTQLRGQDGQTCSSLQQKPM